MGEKCVSRLFFSESNFSQEQVADGAVKWHWMYVLSGNYDVRKTQKIASKHGLLLSNELNEFLFQKISIKN